MTYAREKLLQIVYYDGSGKHTTTPCNGVTMNRVNLSVPIVQDPTVTYTLWFGTEDDCNTEEVTVPLVHNIVPI